MSRLTSTPHSAIPNDDAAALRSFYPPIEPLASGLLDVGDGQQMYWEECGNPQGIPAVFIHGGPGGGCSQVHRQVFDPQRYRIILFDQRGCGRSLPHAWEPEADLSTNTTWHLVADMEKLREHLGVERWLIFGGSWGSTLGLAYAQRHPERVLALVLRGIFTLRRRELEWYYEAGGADMIWPDEWEHFVAAAGQDVEPGGFIQRYHELLTNPDPQVHVPAGMAWSTWENMTSTLLAPERSTTPGQEAHFAVTFARIENHFFYHQGWMEEGQLIRDAHILADHGIPGVIVQGRYDTCCPLGTAWALHRVWPQAELHISPRAGHSFSEPETLSALIEATDYFAQELDVEGGTGAPLTSPAQ